MLEVAQRPEEFEALVNALSGHDRPSQRDELPPRPAYVDARQLNDNSDLSGGFTLPPVDIEQVRAALLSIPAEVFLDRDVWRHKLAAPLAWVAVAQPQLADDAGALMHQVSNRAGAFRGAYPLGANNAEWEALLADTERRLLRGGAVSTVGTLLHLASAHGWVPDQEPPASSTVGPRILRLSDQLAQPPSYKRRPIHDGVAIRGEVTLVVSPGEVAKSTLMAAVAVAVASGKNLLGSDPGPRVPTLTLNVEDCSGEMSLKFLAVAKHFGLRTSDTCDVHFAGAEQAPNLVLLEPTPDGRRLRVREAAITWLRAKISETGAKLVVIDPLAAVIPDGQNDSGAMAQVMRALKSVATDCDAGLVLVAHTRKGGDHTTEGAEITAGSGAITNLARGVMKVGMVDAKTCQEIGVAFGDEGNVREIIDLKANTRLLNGRRYFRLAPVPMGNGTPEYPDQDRVVVAERFTPSTNGGGTPIAALKDVVLAIAAGTSGGQPYSPSHQASARHYLPAIQRALTPHLPTSGPSELAARSKRVLQELLAKGWVVSTSLPIPPSRNVRAALQVVWSATPWASDPSPGGCVQ